MPPGITFQDNGNGTATLSGTPEPSTGAYDFNITAGNGSGGALQTFTLTVVAPPIIAAISGVTVTVGQTISIPITATAGMPLAFSYTESGKLPSGVRLIVGKNGAATIAGKPGPGTAGAYPVTITAHNSAFASTQSFTLVVGQANAITSLSKATLVAGQGGTFLVKTTGFPFPTFSLGGTSVPGVSLTSNNNGTATLTAPSAAVPAGTYTLAIGAGNSFGGVTQSFVLTVVQPPSLTITGNPTFTAGATAAPLTVSATAGSTAGALTIRESGRLPAGMALTIGKNGTATLGGKLGITSGGDYPITLTAANGAYRASQTITLVVGQSVAIATGNKATLVAGQGGTFLVKTTGFPFATFSLGGTSVPGVSLVSSNNGTATLTAPSANVPAGTYTLAIGASNSFGGVTPPQQFTLTVVQPPSLTITGNPTFTAGTTATPLTVTATAGSMAGALHNPGERPAARGHGADDRQEWHRDARRQAGHSHRRHLSDHAHRCQRRLQRQPNHHPGRLAGADHDNQCRRSDIHDRPIRLAAVQGERLSCRAVRAGRHCPPILRV